MNPSNEWQRVSSDKRCPICGRGDWCCFIGPHHDPEVVMCMRVREGGFEKEAIDGSTFYLHFLKRREDGFRQSRRRTAQVRQNPQPLPEMGCLAAQLREGTTDEQLTGVARRLGVTVGSLKRLGTGWIPADDACSFPMFHPGSPPQIVGIRLRSQNGCKWSIPGSRQGLFLPTGLAERASTVLVCEGPTDTAAALSIGFEAVGRPSCSSGGPLLVDLVRISRPAQLVVVADADGPGRHGAEKLAAMLATFSAQVRVVEPPEGTKDIRAWVQSGATREDMLKAINAASPRRIPIRVTRKGGE